MYSSIQLIINNVIDQSHASGEKKLFDIHSTKIGHYIQDTKNIPSESEVSVCQGYISCQILWWWWGRDKKNKGAEE